MDHIRLHDWCSSTPDVHFVSEDVLDNSVTERILNNKFYHPMISSDEEDNPGPQYDWAEFFQKNTTQKKDQVPRRFVAGLRALPPYPRVSALDGRQHYSGVKILSAENRYILQTEFMGRVYDKDRDDFKKIKEIYEKEQKEYIEWAQTLWTTNHCIRALRPKPTIETVYEARFKMKAEEMSSFPKQYRLAAHICFETKEECSFKHVKDLVRVKVSDLPQIFFPNMTSRKQSILRPCPVPEPCNQHPTSFVLPTEKTKSILPLTEIHKELAQYALDNQCQYVASESALRCLINTDSQWTLPVTVAAALNPDGVSINVLVLGSEFPLRREFARTRTYRAYRHLLEHSLIPPLERARILEQIDQISDAEDSTRLDRNLSDITLNGANDSANEMVDLDSDDEEPLVIAVKELSKADDNDSDSDAEQALQIAEESDSESPTQQPDGNTTPNARNTRITSPNASNYGITTPNARNTSITSPNASNYAITTPNARNTSITSPNASNYGITTPNNTRITSPNANNYGITSPNTNNSSITSPNASNNDTTICVRKRSREEIMIIEQAKSNADMKLPKVVVTRVDLSQSNITPNKTSITNTTSCKDRKRNAERNAENVRTENGNNTKEKFNKNKMSLRSSDTFYECSCKNSLFKMPPPRSFKKWQLKGIESNKKYDIIVHCSHKARRSSDEVVVEPIPEYQIDLGASRQSDDNIRALTLALSLRNSASLVTARVDAPTGELVTIDNMFPEEFKDIHGNKMNEISGTLHAALTQLTGLLPGHYLLVHEPRHGSNAVLYAASTSTSANSLTLEFDNSLPVDEAASVKVPPTLSPVLLPSHKFRKILPCAFTPFENQVAKEQKKAPVKHKPPPQALKWTKRNRKLKTNYYNNQ